METHNSLSSYTVQKQPHNSEAELAFISLAIHSPVYLEKMEDSNIDGTFFYNPNAACVLETILDVRKQLKGDHPSQRLVMDKLRGMNGSRDYLEYYRKAFETAIPKSDKVFELYLNRLVDAKRKREYLRMVKEAEAMVLSEAVTSDEIANLVLTRQEEIDHIMKPVNILSGATLEKALRDYYADAPNQPAGAKWGIDRLDKYTGGTRLGEFSLLYAPPGFGKSSLFLQTAYHRAKRLKRPQLYLTIGDMTFIQDWNRIMQQETGVSGVELARGSFVDHQGLDQSHKVEDHLSSLKNIPFFIYQDNMLQSGDVRRLIKSVLRQVPFVDVYIDHIGQFTDKAENIYMKTVEIASVLLRCAHDLKNDKGQPVCSINAISPINKGEQVAGAQDLKHAAENIYKLEPEKPENGGPNKELEPSAQSGLINFIIEKNRNGGTGKVPLHFEAPLARFFDPELVNRRK